MRTPSTIRGEAHDSVICSRSQPERTTTRVLICGDLAPEDFRPDEIKPKRDKLARREHRSAIPDVTVVPLRGRQTRVCIEGRRGAHNITGLCVGGRRPSFVPVASWVTRSRVTHREAIGIRRIPVLPAQSGVAKSLGVRPCIRVDRCHPVEVSGRFRSLSITCSLRMSPCLPHVLIPPQHMLNE